MATEKSDPVVSFITLISAGSTFTYFVVVWRARTQSKDIPFWQIHEYRSWHRSGAGWSGCCTKVPGAAPLLSGPADWWWHPWGHGQGSASLSLAAEAAVVGTVLQGHHCWEDSQVLPPSAEPQMSQGFTSVPVHHEYLHFVFLWHQHPDPSLNTPKELLLGYYLFMGIPGHTKEMPRSCVVVCSSCCSHQHLSWSCRRAFLGSPGSFCAKAQKPTWHWRGSFSPVCWSRR